MSNKEEKYLELSDKIQAKESEVGIEGLNNNERQFYLVDSLLMELNNGGFDQYFSNSSGEFWGETLNVLEKLGLTFLAGLGKKANKIYQSNKSEDDKLDKLSELNDEFYELEYEETYKKLVSLFS
jgi:hypothetical protein